LEIRPITSAVLCCPNGWSAYTLFPYCLADLLEFTYFEASTVAANVTNFAPTTPATTFGGSSSPVYELYGIGIPVMWQITDLSKFVTSGPSSSATSNISLGTGVTSSLPQSTGTSTSPNETTTSQTSSGTTSKSLPTSNISPPASTKASGLSSGAKIGIGLLIPLVLLAFASISIFFYRRRALRKKSIQEKYPEQSELVGAEIHQQFPELSSAGARSELHADYAWGELDGNQRSELHADSTASELRADRDRAELSGNSWRNVFWRLILLKSCQRLPVFCLWNYLFPDYQLRVGRFLRNNDMDERVFGVFALSNKCLRIRLDEVERVISVELLYIYSWLIIRFFLFLLDKRFKIL